MWSEGGVNPPSTAMKSGEGDCVIKDEMYARSGLIDALMNGCRLRVPVAMNYCIDIPGYGEVRWWFSETVKGEVCAS